MSKRVRPKRDRNEIETRSKRGRNEVETRSKRGRDDVETKSKRLSSARFYVDFFTSMDILHLFIPPHIVQEEKENPAYLKLEELCMDNPDDFDYEPMWYGCPSFCPYVRYGQSVRP